MKKKEKKGKPIKKAKAEKKTAVKNTSPNCKRLYKQDQPKMVRYSLYVIIASCLFVIVYFSIAISDQFVFLVKYWYIPMVFFIGAAAFYYTAMYEKCGDDLK